MTRTGLAKGVLAIAGILVFLWARDDDGSALRWVAIALIAAAWLLRFRERGSRRSSSTAVDEERASNEESASNEQSAANEEGAPGRGSAPGAESAPNQDDEVQDSTT